MDEGDLWVFAYGSLIWRPGFDHVERRAAQLQGYRRRFCMRSVHYRGTPDRPGLVLALAPHQGGSCHGVAYRVAAGQAAEVHAYLRERELVSYAYDERHLPVTLDDGREVAALAYVSNTEHPQFCGALSLSEQAAIIAEAEGPMGPNRDYLFQTEQSLGALGIADDDIAALGEMVRALLP